MVRDASLQLDGLTRLAHGDLEPPCRAALVRVISADDGEGELAGLRHVA